MPSEFEKPTNDPEIPNALHAGAPAMIVWQLAWPAVALNSLQVVNNLLDRFFIGHLPAAALTAQGASINVLFLMFSVAAAVGTASTALVSRFFGAGEHKSMRLAAQETLRTALVSGAVAALLTALVAGPSSHLLLPATDTEAAAMMTRFLLAYAIGLPALCAIQTLAGALRAVGDTVSPMFISGLQILLHMSLNSVLIFPAGKGILPNTGFGLGLPGAGLALSLSAWLSALAYIAYASRTPLGRMRAFGIPSWEWTSRILKIAVPAGAMGVLRVASLTAFTFILANLRREGSEAIAAMSVAFAVESIMFMPAFGLSMASGALVGQSLGAKRPDRAERFAWIAAHHGAIVTLLLAGLVFVTSPQIVGSLIDGDKPEIRTQAVWILRAFCLTETLFSYAMTMTGAMQGAGDTRRPLWISVWAMWGMRVPLAYVLAYPLGFGAAGAFASMSITQAVHGIFSIAAFMRGAWKTQAV